MLDTVVAAALKDVNEADEVGIHVGVRMIERVPDAGLGREVDDALRALAGEVIGHRRAVSDVELDEAEPHLFAQGLEPILFEARVVVVVQIVDAEDPIASAEQLEACVEADEAGSAGDQISHEAEVKLEEESLSTDSTDQHRLEEVEVEAKSEMKS